MKTGLITALFAGAALSSPMAAADDGPVSTPSPTTLQPGAYWIRAVVPPNYHKYLQTKPANVAGTAILDSHTTAGQFNVEDGQLVNKVSSPPLYLWVEEPADKASPPPRTLATFFNTTRNPFGTFAWQGDTLTWSVPSIKRQNVAAWLVCANQALFINTGAYGYQTPAGCADQTVGFLFFLLSPPLLFCLPSASSDIFNCITVLFVCCRSLE
ncbi:uncharacterized protein B0T15DRAFT_534697 [Chaetomium strumarium]|uniref:Uncharacterized protein n=1 Tax=Chaetomium strumarium TaxID=1170767 RepID=A0AAJ0M268_9PEZI|nr:hypothetical protein B0T15DRAFT_534697 [Chaetomium strumarium]